jgi:sn-glycerol 3-phosphate transport system substrate-binding protein
VFTALETGQWPHIDLGVGALPGPGRGSLPGGGALWMPAGLPEAEASAAWQLETWLASPAVQARWAAATGYIPITQDAVPLEPLRQAWADHPELAVGYDAVAALGTGPLDLGMQAGPEPEIMAALADAFTDLEEGRPAQEALSRAADTTDELLAAYAEAMDG